MPRVKTMAALPGLSPAARRQLAGIDSSLTELVGQKRTRLGEIIRGYQRDETSGFLMPISDRANLFRKMTTNFLIKPVMPLVGSPIQYFTNPLVLPEVDTDIRSASLPTDRVTNAGFVVSTVEFDPTDIDGVETMLAWTRNGGGIFNVDRLLSNYRDYRGFCVVYSGNRSLHFHFIFDTKHITSVPWDADHTSRLARAREQSVVMKMVHERHWDKVTKLMTDILDTPCEPDRTMRSATQWRRFPWGIRPHKKASAIFGFNAGDHVMQMVIAEHIRERAARGADKWLVPADFDYSHPTVLPRSTRRNHGGAGTEASASLALEELQEACRDEWDAEYPKPCIIKRSHDGFVIHFQNTEHDAHPSTVVRGDHRQLIIAGVNTLEGPFFLPENMTANEWCEHLLEKPSASSSVVGDSPGHVPLRPQTNPVLQNYEQSICGQGGLDRTNSDVASVFADTRHRLIQAAGAARIFPEIDYLIIAPEGSGKTTGHYSLLAHEALDIALAANLDDPTQRFCCFASRSLEQAKEKAADIEARLNDGSGTIRTVVLKSFWAHYRAACSKTNTEIIPRADFWSSDLHGICGQIRELHPQVFEEMERAGAELWSHAPFNGGTTIVCTTHSMVHYWDITRTTRAWYHPDFDPLDSSQNLDRLRHEFAIERIVYDEIERDEFLHILPDHVVQYLKAEKVRWPDWRNKTRSSREGIFRDNIKRNSSLPASFDAYDELMQSDLDRLTPIKVDYDAIPYGFDNRSKGLYRRENGRLFHVGPRDWMTRTKAQYAFLTTERLAAHLIVRLYEGRNLLRLEMDDLIEGIYPVKIPVSIDARANKTKINELVLSLCEEDPEVAIIADGVRRHPNVTTFQSMKGSNEFQNRNVVIIPTMLAPEVYSQLNVLGQYLGLPNVIEMHFQDLINQAVGRNQGFRHGECSTRIICSNRTWSFLKKLNGAYSRVLMYKHIA